MLVGVRARGITATAAAAVGEFSKILGVSVSTKMAGNTIKAIYTKNTMGTVKDEKKPQSQIRLGFLKC
jgi:hypothetical protein